MIKHIVFWEMRPEAEGRTAAENAAEMKVRLEELNGRIPGLLHLEVGIDFGRAAASADVALYSELADRAALEAYQAHPEHRAVGAFVSAVTDSRSVVDYEA